MSRRHVAPFLTYLGKQPERNGCRESVHERPLRSLASVLRSYSQSGLSSSPPDSVYTARLFDYHFDHPDLLRLVTWERLEGRTTPATQAQRTTSYRRRTDAIKSAQQEGKVSTAVSAPHLLDIIESLAVGWTKTARGLLVDTRKLNRERTAYRAGIAEAVQRIVRTR